VRALTLVVLVWSLAVGGALADYALGTSVGTQWIYENMTADIQAVNVTVSGDYLSWTINAITNGFSFLWTVVKYGFLLGELVKALTPENMQVPSIFIDALNGFSLIINMVGVVQFISGRSMQAMD